MKKTYYKYNKKGQLIRKCNNKGKCEYIKYWDNGNKRFVETINKSFKIDICRLNDIGCNFNKTEYDYELSPISRHVVAYDINEYKIFEFYNAYLEFFKNEYEYDSQGEVVHAYFYKIKEDADSPSVKWIKEGFYENGLLSRLVVPIRNTDGSYKKVDIGLNEYNKKGKLIKNTEIYYDTEYNIYTGKDITNYVYYDDDETIKEIKYERFDNEDISIDYEITENDEKGEPIKIYDESGVFFERVDFEGLDGEVISNFIRDDDYVCSTVVYELDNNGNKRKIYREDYNDHTKLTSSTVYKYNKKGLLSSKTKKKHAQRNINFKSK